MPELKIITPEMERMLEFIERDIGLREYVQLEHMKKQGLTHLILSATLKLPEGIRDGGYGIEYCDFEGSSARVIFSDLGYYDYYQKREARIELGDASQRNFVPNTIVINKKIQQIQLLNPQ